ncbi:MAG: PD-(D/E)XK nuclease family protein [Candidatus Altiarchaeales archaeon]|nr:PD-(D/E)XK nuclease family protein [Candidatus Altiarchaeota archaeon]MCG2782699.1 PD-(D/E)XK nuclease family protein [Candidatus Altiarchaeales archaeon]
MICPECGSSRIIKKGRRQRKRRTLQQYKCNSCGRHFTEQRMEKKMYSPNVILAAMTHFNTDSNLVDAAKKVNKRFAVKTYPQLISAWLNEFEKITSYQRVRKATGPVEDIIFEHALSHLQPYNFKYHKVKVESFINEYFSSLREFLENIPEACPDELFCDENHRGSQLDIVNADDVSVEEKENYACKIADLALKGVVDNRKRHEAIQHFMLCNDTATVAVEVPVWLYPWQFNNLKLFSGVEKPLTGHIDLLQMRYGLIHVLDYKPGAERETPISQLFLYALALSRRTGIWLRNFRCAWFDDKVYYEFQPSEIILKHEDVPERDRKMYVLDEGAHRFYTSPEFQEVREDWEKPSSNKASVSIKNKSKTSIKDRGKVSIKTSTKISRGNGNLIKNPSPVGLLGASFGESGSGKLKNRYLAKLGTTLDYSSGNADLIKSR